MTSEINPGEQIRRLLRSWWIVVICMLVFGMAGYVIHTLRPALYESKATFNVWLDFNFLKTDREFTEYDEDLSINSVGDSYVAPDIIQQVTDEALKQGWIQAPNEIFLNYRLERKHSGWELRYLSTNPQTAMDLTNFWATTAYRYLVDLEKTEAIPAYVRFSEPTLAVLPTQPVRYGRNDLVLAGSLIGLVIGILLSGFLSRKGK